MVVVSMGCGAGAAVRLAEVEGLVSLAGKPLENVEVQFVPEPTKESKNAPRSTAVTDAQGRFRLTCDDQRPGAFVGTHRVTIRDLQASGSSFPVRERDPEGKDAPIAKVGPARFPEAYGDLARTPLRREVKAEKQTINLELNTTP